MKKYFRTYLYGKEYPKKVLKSTRQEYPKARDSKTIFNIYSNLFLISFIYYKISDYKIKL